MFVSIRTKLFVLLILANALMVGVLLTLNAASFSRSFSDYIAQQEARRLEPLLQNIATQYERRGDWRWLKWDNPEWIRVVRQSFSPREMRSFERFIAPPAADGNRENKNDNGGRGFFDRIAVRDSQTNKTVLGRKRPSDKLIWLPILDSNNVEIAQFGFEPTSRLDSQFDDLFAKQQQKNLIIISVFGFVIAGALAIPFSGVLVKPIRNITSAVRHMTQGDLTVSVNESRSDELGQLAQDFNQLAKVLKKNQVDRQQWVSDIAHELRTPVAIFQADIEAAQDGVREVNDKWLSNLHSHVERLTRLVNDLHQLSQSDAGTLAYTFHPVDTNELIENTIEQFEKACADGHLTVIWQASERSAMVQGDATRLNQLFANLAQNTLRYTDGSEEHPGYLKITTEHTGESVRMEWEDSSPGVGINDLSRLFERLYRVDESRARATGGSGLGLAIVKNIVEAHQGTIHAEQSSLGGLKIVITLPKSNA